MEIKNKSSSDNLESGQNINNKQNSPKTEINLKKEKESEIDLLKKEISFLKNKSQQDEKNINELKSLFQIEIKKLQDQIKFLSDELKSIKSKKVKKDIDNIDNINNNIDIEEEDDENIEIDDHKYSLECLSRKLNVDINQGTDRTSIDIAVKNNSKLKFPNNSSLECDVKKSLLLCESADLGQLEPNEQKIIKIYFNNLKHISKGQYKCIVQLKAENKIYSSSTIELTINVIAPRHIENNQINNLNFNNNPINNNLNNINNQFMQNLNNNNNNIASFREQFSLFDYDNLPDEIILNALMSCNNDFNKAFESLFS